MQWEQDLLEPQSLAELCDIVKESSFVRVVGRGHSFVPVCKARAAPRSATISLNKMNRVLDIDSEAMTVTIEGGITAGSTRCWTLRPNRSRWRTCSRTPA